MMSRFVITVSRGRKILLREQYVTYAKAMEALDRIEVQFRGFKIEFKDNQPFGYAFGG